MYLQLNTGRAVIFAAAIICAFAALMMVRELPVGRQIKTVAVVNHAAIADRSFEGLRQGLAERGWREGETIRYLYAGAEASTALLREQAREYIESGADLVVALSTPAALAAHEVARSAGVPLLLAPASDAVAVGLVTSLAHPGQAVTGVTFALQEPRRLEWLTRLAPSVRKVWVPFNHSDSSPAATVARLGTAAAKLGLTLVTADVRSPAELQTALDTLPADVDAIFVPPDAVVASQTDRIAAVAAKRKLPVTTPHREGVVQGALFSYGFELNALGRQAARLADQILKGTPATDLPIETADTHVSINVAVADALGLSIPDEVLRHAVLLGRRGG